jgi:hypothetical protein
MPRKREDEPKREAPRTDLPPRREPYYDGYFGTEEEEGVERERDEGERKPDPEPERRADEGGRDAVRRVAEDAAGGDREIM